MEIIKQPKKTKTWPDRLRDLEVNENFYVEVTAAQTLSTCISRLKIETPGRDWTVIKHRDPKSGEHTHASVTRIA